MIDEGQRCKVVELGCVCGKCGHGAGDGKDAISGVLGRKSGYELLQALLTITFACGIERVRQAVGPKKKHVTVAHHYRLALEPRIEPYSKRQARGCDSIVTSGLAQEERRRMTAIASGADTIAHVDDRSEQRCKHCFVVVRDEQIVGRSNGGVERSLLPERDAKCGLSGRHV